MNNQLKLLLYLVFIVIIFYFVQDRFQLFDISFQDKVPMNTAEKVVENQENSEEEVAESIEKGNIKDGSSVEIFRQSGGSVKVSVEIVDTEEERTLGLSNRRNLGDYNGMLFVFDSPTNTSFWMKDMYIDLDIIFIDSQGFIVDIEKEAQPCESVSGCPKILSSKSFKYVLEVNGGFVDLNKVAVGDSVSLDL